MCGICGEISLRSDETPSVDIVRTMCQSMRHRGPDSSGDYNDHRVTLGSARLSIIDLEGGQQPIHNEDQTIWTVLNGEIYNFQSLRRQLEHLGHRFYTRSDTEALVHAYEEFGLDFVRHLNGMFAFAIWDSKKDLLLIARDRVGIKPLFYAETEHSVIFASELKVMLTHPRIDPRIDLVALNEYLTYEYVPTPRSMIRGVKKLSPGHILTVRAGRVETQQYWDIRLERSEIGRKSVQEYEHELQENLHASVRKELVSDVPVGVLLSGGLDSSAIALAAASAYPGTIKTFTAAFEDPSFDESAYARIVAEATGTEHHEFTVRAADLLDLVPKLGELVDEPLGDSSFVPTYLLCRHARQHVKVALGGDGGDELFAGYPTYQAHKLIEYFESLVPGSFRRSMIPALVDRIPTSFDNVSLDFKIKRFVSGRGLPLGVRHHQWLGSFSDVQKRDLLTSWARIEDRDTFEIVSEHQQRCSARHSINQLLYWDMKMYLEGDILQKVDRASMASSLEVRVPLLNHSFVEWATTIPHDLKLRGLTTKYLFRRSLRKSLPPTVVRRKKKGFNMPVAKWLSGPLRELTEEMFSETRLRRDGLFQPQIVRRLLEDHYGRRADNRKMLWTLLVFQLWNEQLSQRQVPPPPNGCVEPARVPSSR
jgi:asparagine synthase (glutamine-hydrolysing)